MDKRIQTGLIVLVILVLVHILTEVDLLDKKKMAEVEGQNLSLLHF